MRKNYDLGFGEVMRKSRKEKKLTQAQLAEQVGISVTYCRKIERDQCLPGWILWLKICLKLDIDIKTFMSKVPPVEDSDEY